MPLQTSGAIGLDDVNIECGFSATTTIGLNDSRPRTLTSKASGQISLNDCYGCMYVTEGSAGYDIGYEQGICGSIFRTTFSGGQTIRFIYDDTYYGQAIVGISGFASDPGQNGFWTSVQRGTGTTLTASSASSYYWQYLSFYGVYVATWYFSGTSLGCNGSVIGYKWAF
jgi:hypothetical protein